MWLTATTTLVLTAFLSTTSSLQRGISIKNAIIFKNINKITATRFNWKLNFIIDIKQYKSVTIELENKIQNAEKIITEARKSYTSNSMKSQYESHFSSLKKEVDFIKLTQKNIENKLTQYKHLQRKKRAIFQPIGNFLGEILGLSTSNDIDGIRQNIKTLEESQNNIAHVVEKSLTFINTSRNEIAENRKRLNDIQILLTKIITKVNTLESKLEKTDEFLHIYIQLRSLIENTKGFLHEIEIVFLNFDAKINFISQGKITPSVIEPSKLKTILSDIKKQLPPTLFLAIDPYESIDKYYQLLSCKTTLLENQIIITTNIPILDATEKLNIFIAIPIPIITHVRSNNKDYAIAVSYDTNNEGLAINADQTKYTILTQQNIRECQAPKENICELHNPIYPTRKSNNCLVSLFTNNDENAKAKCQRKIVNNFQTPKAIYLTEGLWLVFTQKEATFTIKCKHLSKTYTNKQTVKSPVGILTLKKSCSASNQEMKLPTHLDMTSTFYDQNELITTLAKLNTSNTTLWKPFRDSLPKLSISDIPKSLGKIKRLNLNELITKLHQKPIIKDNNSNQWIITIFIFAFGLLSILVITKRNTIKKIMLKLPKSQKIATIEKTEEKEPKIEVTQPIFSQINN